jgi:GTP:adenosylcobinamide-phosphate guanylyltransferase
MPQLSAVVIAGEPSSRSREVSQEMAMISALGRPLIDYVLDTLRSCREVSDVLVCVTGSTPLTESHVQSRGFQSISTEGFGYDSDLLQVMRLLSTTYVLAVPANLPLLRPESIDEIVEAFYRSKKSSMVIGVPIDDVQEVIVQPTLVMDMNGVKAMPCGVRIMDRNLALNHSGDAEAYLVTDLEDFTVEVNTIGQLRRAEGILRARGWRGRKP